MSNDKDLMRDEFEAALLKHMPHADLSFDGEHYSSAWANSAWWGWQAARQQAVPSDRDVLIEARVLLNECKPDSRLLSMSQEDHDRRTYACLTAIDAMLAAAPQASLPAIRLQPEDAAALKRAGIRVEFAAPQAEQDCGCCGRSDKCAPDCDAQAEQVVESARHCACLFSEKGKLIGRECIYHKMRNKWRATPDFSALVEALEHVRYWIDRRCSVLGLATNEPIARIDEALAAHRSAKS